LVIDLSSFSGRCWNENLKLLCFGLLMHAGVEPAAFSPTDSAAG